jgi:HEAT repeat protein
MPREQLKMLAGDVDRLLAAGGAVAAGDEGLRKRAKALREAGHKVPALAQIAEATDRVVQAGPARAARALLDLILVVRQVRAGLATAGVDGPLEPLEPAGPWATSLNVRDVYATAEALAAGRIEPLRDAIGRGAIADLRLVGACLTGLSERHGEMADLIAEGALPAFGPAALPSLRRELDLKGKAADVRRLVAICKIDAAVGAALCRRAIDEGSNALRVQALKCYPQVDPEGAERAALALLTPPTSEGGDGEADGDASLTELVAALSGGQSLDSIDSSLIRAADACLAKRMSDWSSREVRAAAVAALGSSKSEAALDALVSAASDYPEVWSAASSALVSLPHPGVIGRLVRELEAAAALAGAPPRPAKSAAPVKHKGKAKPPAKGKARGKDKEAATEDRIRSRATERACRLAALLAEMGRRGDRAVIGATLPLLKHPASDLREAAVKALADVGGPPELEAAAALVDDPKVWKAAVQAVWKLPPKPLYDRLAPLCADLSKKSPDGRGKYLLGLFEKELNRKNRRTEWDPRWGAALTPHLKGASRPDVALALALTVGTAAVPTLLKALEPSVKKGECGVVEALGKLRAREAIGPMIALMPGQPSYHHCVHDALKLIGDPAAIPPLQNLMKATRDLGRKARIKALISELERLAAKPKTKAKSKSK